MRNKKDLTIYDTRHYPVRPHVGVGVLLIREETLLLVKRKFNPDAGYWSIPGGHLDLGERVQNAAIREALEETGFKVKIKDLAGIIDGIEDFSHLLVLYWAHHVLPEGRSITKAHPMGRKDLPLVGVFATCSPARPNPVCATVVRLLERKGNVLKVQGLDAVDGSPIVDIKPYNPSYYVPEDVKVADWMERIHREIAGGSIGGGDSKENW